MADAVEETSYRGLLGAFPYAFRRSDSRVFKAYAVIGGALAVCIALVFAFALITLIADTAAASDGTLSLIRAFFILVGLLIVLPIVAPVLFVARRHRRTVGDDVEYDRRLALAGFAFIGSVYVALIVSTPRDQQTSTEGFFGPVLETLYALPWPVAFVPPIAAIAVLYGAHRFSR